MRTNHSLTDPAYLMRRNRSFCFGTCPVQSNTFLSNYGILTADLIISYNYNGI